MASVSVGVLGPVTLDTADGPARVGGARLRALLARLALDAGHAVRPATLIEALWDTAAPDDHGHALQSLVSRLRQVAGDPGLVTSGPAGYRLEVEPDAVDVVRFERLARAARQALPAEAATVLREALGLWRGPALADVGDAPFAAAEAECLERARLSALEDRMEADLAQGPGLDLVGELEALAAAHPLRERLHAQLIRALALHGRDAEALDAYQRVRALLAETFGADPGPQLQQAHLAVLRGEAPRRPRGNLHLPLTSFVGRDDDVRRVTGLLAGARLVTLVGPGGSGKTRLAGTIGRQLTPPGGVWFVPFAPIGADDVPRAVLDLLPRRDDRRGSALDQLTGTIADDDLVLILDNCEHVIDAAAELAETLLTRCPNLRIVATSREALRIDGETLHPVLPLALPADEATAAEAGDCAAVRLFHDRAAAVQPDLTLDGGALTAAVEICRRLDGLPLAIELAAAQLRALPIEAVAARLDDRFPLLTGGSRTAQPRHRTLTAAIAWSWDLLEPDERTLLERLAIIPAPFTEDAARAVGDLAGVPLTALVAKSLLHPVPAADPLEPRFRMLETIREYGLARLEDASAVRERHARYFLRLAETADPHLRTSGQLPWLARLSAERDNLSAAIRWTTEYGDADRAVRFGVALSWYWFLRDHPPESLDLLGRVLQVSEAADPGSRAVVIAAHALAVAETITHPDAATAAFSQLSEALRADPPSHPVLAMARLALAVSAGHDAAGGTRAVPDDPWGRSLDLLVRGVLAMNGGHAAEAVRLLSAALDGFEEVGERWGLATTMTTLNAALQRSGDPAGAPALVERATGYFTELGMPEHTMESEVAAALDRAESGDVDGGRRHLTSLLDRASSAESRTQALLGLARLEWRAGHRARARAHALTGLSTSAQEGRATPHLTASLLCVLAQVDAADGRPDEAARRLDDPAVHLTLTWHTPVATAIAVAAASIELGRDHPEGAALLLGAARALHTRDDPDLRAITTALGELGFAAGAAMSRPEAEALVTKAITA